MNQDLKKIIDDKVIEKYINKYIPNRSDYIKEEAKQHILLCILESDYERAKNPINYMIGIIINQLNSNNSSFYKEYIAYDNSTVSLDLINERK